MTVFNDLRFLDVAVDSILRQEFRDLELVIVGDGTGEDALFKAAPPPRQTAASGPRVPTSSCAWMRTILPSRRVSDASSPPLQTIRSSD
jgi:hypothetical protein